MPGFSINSDGGTPEAKPGFYTSYNWSLESLANIPNINRIHVKSLKIPSVSFEEEIVKGFSINYKVAKLISTGDIELIFYDTMNIYDEILKWQSKVWNSQDGIGFASEYCSDFDFVLNRTDGEKLRFRAINTWPKTIDHSLLTYESSEVKTIILTLACTMVSKNPQTQSREDLNSISR